MRAAAGMSDDAIAGVGRPRGARRTLAALGLLLSVAVGIAGCGGGTPGTHAATVDPGASAALQRWPMFGITPQRPSATTAATGITAASLPSLVRQRIAVPGTVDGSPAVSGDSAYATTTYGRTFRLDLATGGIAWTFTPAAYARVRGTAQITTASPVLDPTGRWLYAASSDGDVHKLAAATGKEAPGWPVAVTRDPVHEKLAAPLGLAGGRVLVATGGYIGDIPPYQGKVVTLDAGTGRIDGVFDALCSDRHAIFAPATCPSTDAAIWGRAGVVVVPGSGNLLVATSNGGFDGRTNWGDSVLLLSPDARRLLAHWTPVDQHRDDTQDLDVGSTSPALLGGGLVLQGGKDARLHLLDLARLHGVTGAAAHALGGDLQILPTPGGQPMFTAPAVLRAGGTTTVFVATGGGTAAYRVAGRRLHPLWKHPTPGTSPVAAGGLLYVYAPDGTGLAVYRPATGQRLATLPAGPGHWNSPVVADGRIVLPEGNANDHLTTGTLDVWS